MALILAVNPGSTQNATLSRLARELPNCELVGADSYSVAIKAIDQRAPDLVLLPGTDALAEAELLRRLRAVPHAVATLKLPPPLGIDVKALAADVRRVLRDPAGASLHIGASPHLLAAAAAAVNWVRARRAVWEETGGIVEAAYSPAIEPGEPSASDDTDLVARLREAALDVERERERQRQLEADEPSALEMAAEAATELGAKVTNWLPRLAIAAAVLVAAAAAVIYWPAIRGMPATAESDVTATQQQSPQATTAPVPAATAAPNTPSSSQPAAPDTAAADASGWIAVFAPFEITISEGVAHVPLDEAGRAVLPAGQHRLRFRNVELGYDEVRAVRIKPTETTTLNLAPKTTLAVTSSEPAEVLLDGAIIGQAPIEQHRVDYGAHTVTVRAGTQERQFSVEATMKPIELKADFAQP